MGNKFKREDAPLINKPTPWHRVLGKLTVAKVVKKFLTFYET
jgi:hypothetical protein